MQRLGPGCEADGQHAGTRLATSSMVARLPHELSIWTHILDRKHHCACCEVVPQHGQLGLAESMTAVMLWSWLERHVKLRLSPPTKDPCRTPGTPCFKSV
jgi:hypothetical protein